MRIKIEEDEIEEIENKIIRIKTETEKLIKEEMKKTADQPTDRPTNRRD